MQPTAWTALLLAGAATLVGAAGNSAGPQSPAAKPFAGVLDEHPAIQYGHRPTRDRVSVLNRALAEGTVSLPFQ